MNTILRDRLIDRLENGWGTYVVRFHTLAAPEQMGFLQQQGYARLADLLAHISAWWQVGIQDVQNSMADPAYQSPPYEVDSFNARAVQAASSRSENEVIENFEAVRLSYLDLVRNLPDHAYAQDVIARRLEIDIIGHLDEHNLPV